MLGYQFLFLSVKRRMASGFFRTPSAGGGVGENYDDPPYTFPGAIKKVCVLGHSYVRRIIVNEYLYEPFFTVTPLSAPGATIAGFRQTEAWGRFVDLKPDLTFLVLGGNDLHPDTDAGELARGIEELAREVEALSGGSVIIIGIEKRQDPRYMTAAAFNTLRNRVNRYLKAYIPWTRTRYHSMCTHEEDFSLDGIHLHEDAQESMFEMLLGLARKHFAIDEAKINEKLVEAMRSHFESKPNEFD